MTLSLLSAKRFRFNVAITGGNGAPAEFPSVCMALLVEILSANDFTSPAGIIDKWLFKELLSG